jgi:hypothetical protein
MRFRRFERLILAFCLANRNMECCFGVSAGPIALNPPVFGFAIFNKSCTQKRKLSFCQDSRQDKLCLDHRLYYKDSYLVVLAKSCLAT